MVNSSMLKMEKEFILTNLLNQEESQELDAKINVSPSANLAREDLVDLATASHAEVEKKNEL